MDLPTSDSSGDGDDELAHAHANGAQEQKVATTQLLYEVETWKSGNDVDRVGDDLNGEWILEAGALKVSSSVVEDEVHPCKCQSII